MWLQIQTLLLTPICPHTCDHVWRDKLQQQGTVLTAGWPEAPQPRVALQVCLSHLSFCACCPSGLPFTPSILPICYSELRLVPFHSPHAALQLCLGFPFILPMLPFRFAFSCLLPPFSLLHAAHQILPFLLFLPFTLRNTCPPHLCLPSLLFCLY